MKYFRNRTEVFGIEPECLWKLERGIYVLVDDDQHIAVPDVDPYNSIFYEVTI